MSNPTSPAKLLFDQETLDLPIYQATLGPNAVDVKNVSQHGFLTYDEGFYSTAACKSSITYIDGDEGVLLHRGYPIEQLSQQCDFLTVCFLLLNGELPDRAQFALFSKTIQEKVNVRPEILKLYSALSRDTHPMSLLISVTSALTAFYPNLMNVNDAQNRQLAAHEMIGQIASLTALAHRHTSNQAFIPPHSELCYTSNFLNMMFGSEPDPVLTRAMDRIFILHADHEQNASTSTVRMAGSTGTHPFAAVSAGIAALWGPAHGGANEACIRMLTEIKDESRIGYYIERAKNPNDAFRLMGFGHRVYKNYEPRAKVMQATCHEVLTHLGRHDDALFKLALKLEKIALEDEYFISRKLYPNVDFYSGLTLSALGIPMRMFTALFALARTAGWMAHWMEMLDNPEHRLARPRQLYTGYQRREKHASE